MVYGYVRVSTDKQTTENQRFEIEKFTKSRNMRIDRWVDETISGTKVIADRQLGKLLKQIRKGDILITTELSRLGDLGYTKCSSFKEITLTYLKIPTLCSNSFLK